MAQGNKSVGTYIDLFSGCGGFSLGLGNAGWQGLFAVEKDPMAFETFKHNLIDGPYKHFNWPGWLPQEATTIQKILRKHKSQLQDLSGKVDLIVGGPPCQGFSLAGQRNPNDPRNKLSNQYLKIVKLVNPKYILLENVRGFNAKFTDKKNKKTKKPQAMLVKNRLEKIGYTVFTNYINSEDYGVPQSRQRFIMIGIRNDVVQKDVNPFEKLVSLRELFLESKGLPQKPVSVKQAIQDLEIERSQLVDHGSRGGFKKIHYKQPNYVNSYLKVMRKGSRRRQPNSLRIPRHKESTVDRFIEIQEICRPGFGLLDSERESLNIKKQVIAVLDPNRPSRTVTTLPDDLLHYSEPRILTVRENARIQSFPDNFEFKGKYTTGGKLRTQECPRYTQVGNAVPPFLGEVLGKLIKSIG